MKTSRRSIFAASVFVIGLGLMSACGGGKSDSSSPTSPSGGGGGGTSNNPGAPHISTLSPNTPIASGSMQSMTVTGTNFKNGMSVLLDNPKGVWTWYDGTSITLNSDSSFTLKAMIDLTGLWDITVKNADGAESNEVQFNVVPSNATK